MIKECARLAAQSYWPFLRSSLGVLLPLWILAEVTDQYFALAAKLALRGSPEHWMAQVGQLATAVTVSFVVILLLPVRLKDWQDGTRPYRSWTKIAHDYTWPLFVEGLRMTAYVILWSVAFVIPGIYKQVRYLFVPFVVLLDPHYQKGEVDALERSAELTKGVFGWLLGLFLISFAAEIGFEMAAKVHPTLTHPVARVLTGGLAMMASIYFYSVFYFIYDARTKQILAAHENQEGSK